MIKIKKRRQETRNKIRSDNAVNAVFYPLVILTFVLWSLYRSLFRYPVWFDETIGKAIFFALPVWLFISLSRNKDIKEIMDLKKLKPGLLMGLAIGGLFGFTTSLVTLIIRSKQVESLALFLAAGFWWEFFLGLMTAFWESLFFFGFILNGIMAKQKTWPLLNQIIFSAFWFLLFHLPNIVLRFSGLDVVTEILILFLFAIGQGLVFAKTRNFYTLVISHTVWGMVLLIHV